MNGAAFRRLRLPSLGGLPILAKELTEQAARRRTFMLRMGYALALLVFFFAAYVRVLAPGRSQIGLGQGKPLLDLLVMFGFGGIYLFLPAMVVGSVVQEKESGALPLLLLTGMSPWRIVLEKLLSRLVPMAAILLLALPPMALAYSLGGFTADAIGRAVFWLGLACLEVGAFSLLVAAFCYSAVTGLIFIYLLGAFYYFGLPALIAGTPHAGRLEILFPPRLLESSAGLPLSETAALALPTAGFSLLFLLLARAFFVRGALAPGGNVLLRFFRRLDAFYHRANRSRWLGGGIEFFRRRKDLPKTRPVAWREVSRRALGKPEHFLRALLLLEVPVLAAGTYFLVESTRARFGPAYLEEFSAINYAIWGLATVAILAGGIQAIGRERRDGTLEVLLTTPISRREIAIEKYDGLKRLRRVFAAPLVTGIVFRALAGVLSPYGGGVAPAAVYLACALLNVVILLPTLSWYSLWIGLKYANRARALLVAILGFGLWHLVCFGAFGPFGVIAIIEEVSRIGSGSDALATYFWFGIWFQLGSWAFFRSRCLDNAERYLRVAEGA
jgi:ABC-type transport system involved in multi-copper enzyme maturation permease subunit